MIFTPGKIETIVRIIQDTAEINGIDIYAIPEENVDGIIKKGLNSALIEYNEDDYQRIKKEFEYKCHIQQKEGVSIVDDYYEHRDWYSIKCEEEGYNEYFWKRYKEYLIREVKLNINVINNMDNSTLKDLMNYLGDPCSTAAFFRRGLVIGDVQSGKTSTYTGLICKAADTGYKVVILLTGVTETLRSQTQNRIESGIIGYSISGLKNKNQSKTITRVGVGKDNGPLKATAMTSMEYDFVGNIDAITTSLENYKLIIFIVKKNTTVLNKLYHWLYGFNANKYDKKIHYPMLLIDDEADNASINTNKDEDDPTKTNEIIRKLAHVFTQTTYIGFTATPYANVFIYPDTKEEMLNDDLFPKNFIYVLQAPSNYIGPSQIFGKYAKHKDSLIWIRDIEEPLLTEEFDFNNNFYYKHKKEWEGTLPQSLTTAVHCFFLANVVRDLRGDSLEPRTMMVNMTRFVKVQKHIKSKLETLFNDVYDEINTNFSNDGEKNKKLKLYNDLKNVWERYYSDVKIDWKDISKKGNLLQAIDIMEIIVINSGKNSGKLDYEKNPHLRAIAVGGLALSRGLTLEGLITSYFYRNTSTFDVLMQMGRWFGYRKNYEDIFRIWTSKRSANWYNEISDNTEDLKKNLGRMREEKLTPEYFGLKVRNDSDELKITANNKMRNAKDHIEQISYWGKVFDTPYLDVDPDKNHRNLELSKHFFNKLSDEGYQFKKEENAKDLFFRQDIPSDYIINYLKELTITAHNIHFDTKQILDFLVNCDEEILKKWDIVILEGDRKEEPYKLNSTMSIIPVERSFDLKKNRINISGKGGRLGSPTDARCGLTKEQIESAKNKAIQNNDGVGASTINQEVWFKYVEKRNPLLMVYFIKLKGDENSSEEQSFINNLNGSPVMGFSVGFPMNQHSHAAEYHKYKVNVIFSRQEREEDFAESIEE